MSQYISSDRIIKFLTHQKVSQFELNFFNSIRVSQVDSLEPKLLCLILI